MITNIKNCCGKMREAIKNKRVRPSGDGNGKFEILNRTRDCSFFRYICPWCGRVMKKNLIVGLILFGLFLSSILWPSLSRAGGATLRGGYYACITEAYYDQIMTAAMSGDVNGEKYLAGMGVCVVPKAGTKISILEKKIWKLKAKVRAYAGDGITVMLWTHLKNIRENTVSDNKQKVEKFSVGRVK